MSFVTVERRRGSETSETRAAILDTVERLMSAQGYASVTYRGLAAAAGVTAGLIQYYFPTLDDIFGAAIRRRAEQHLERLVNALAQRPDEPLHVLWEMSREEASAVLMTEFLALANHRKSIQAIIADVSEKARQVQVEALRAARIGESQGLKPEELAFLVNGLPKVVGLEAGAGLLTTHASVVATCERFIDVLEPPARATARKRRRVTP